MFDYKNLAVEIRLKILRTLLEPQPNKGVPAILVALFKEPKLYAEAQQLYREINVVVSSKNQAEFQKVKMVDLLKIRCIKLVMESVDVFTPKVDLAGNKCKLRNGFQTVIFEASLPRTDWYWIEVAKFLSSGSQSGICKVVAILAPILHTKNPPLLGRVDTPDRRVKMIEAADKEIGVNGTCVTLGDKQVWTWEKEGGGALEIGERKRGRGRDTGDIGTGCGRD